MASHDAVIDILGVGAYGGCSNAGAVGLARTTSYSAPRADWFSGANFRMNKSTGGALVQLRKRTRGKMIKDAGYK